MTDSSVVASTPLSRGLREAPGRKRVGPLDVFERAREKWTRGEKVEIAALAEELGVSRVTIFRWVGSRELLLGEVIWSLCKPLWEQSLKEASGHGPDFMAEAAFNLMSLIVQAEPLRWFLEQDPEYALRILTSKTSVVQANILTETCLLMQKEVDSGHFQPPFDIPDLGYIVVRIVESFIYGDQIVGRKPKLEIGRDAIRALLASGLKLQAPKKSRRTR